MTSLAGVGAAAVIVLIGLRTRPHRMRTADLPTTITPPAGSGVLAVLEDIERDLRSGVGLVTAVRGALGRQPGALANVRRALECGARLRDALASALPAHPSEVLAVQTLRACELSGGAMGVAVERAVLVLRERDAWERERRVHAAQARLSATVLTFVPLVFAALGAATSPRIRRAYTEIPVCAVAAIIGLGINVIGWVWMRRLVVGAAR